MKNGKKENVKNKRSEGVKRKTDEEIKEMSAKDRRKKKNGGHNLRDIIE